MLKNIPKTLGKLSMIAAAVMAVSAPSYVQANKLPSKNVPVSPSQPYELFDGLAEMRFLAMQNYQSIQAKKGAFRPVDEEQSSSFGRIRVNLQLKFHINEFIRADVDIAEEPNDFGDNGARDFAFHQDFGGIEFKLLGLYDMARDNADLTLRLGNIGFAPFQFKGFQDGADNQDNALIGNGITDCYQQCKNDPLHQLKSDPVKLTLEPFVRHHDFKRRTHENTNNESARYVSTSHC